jgi:putative hemolysin
MSPPATSMRAMNQTPHHALAGANGHAAIHAGTLAEPGRPARDDASTVALEAVWARHADEVAQALRLRHRVFVDEMGARPACLPGTPAGMDMDRFDQHCEHLIVRTVATDFEPERVVGTYRVLMPAAAARLGALYSDGEFDLRALDAMRPRMVELGRSCIAPDFRTGGVILLLWSRLAELMQRHGMRWMVGCASVPMRDGGHVAASLWAGLREGFMAPPELQVQPRLPLPVAHLRSDLKVEAPALIKGYLRCGARLLGAPAWDPDFGTADLPMLLDLQTLPAAYRRRFMGT